MTTEVVARPNPGPQTWALTCPARELLFGGARGGGKSYVVVLAWLTHSSESRGEARGLVLRRTREQLKDFLETCRKIMTPLGWEYADQKHQWRGPDGSVLTLAYLERDSDAEQYMGWNLSFIAVDEAGNFPQPGPIDLLRATLRIPGLSYRMILTANPGGPGHEWLKRRFVDGRKPRTIYKDENGISQCFIPSSIADNPYLDASYRDTVAAACAGKPWLREAWLNGSWDIVPNGGVLKPEAVCVGPLPSAERMRTYIGIDPSASQESVLRGDDAALSVVSMDDAHRWWLRSVEAGKWPTNELCVRIEAAVGLWNPLCVYLEGGPIGRAVEPFLRDRMRVSGRFYNLIVTTHTGGDKVTKAAPFAAATEAGCVWRPEGDLPWWPALEHEMTIFDGMDGKADNRIDATSVIFRHVHQQIGGHAAPEQPKAPVEGSHAWWALHKPKPREQGGRIRSVFSR